MQSKVTRLCFFVIRGPRLFLFLLDSLDFISRLLPIFTVCVTVGSFITDLVDNGLSKVFCLYKSDSELGILLRTGRFSDGSEFGLVHSKIQKSSLR